LNLASNLIIRGTIHTQQDISLGESKQLSPFPTVKGFSILRHIQKVLLVERLQRNAFDRRVKSNPPKEVYTPQACLCAFGLFKSPSTPPADKSHPDHPLMPTMLISTLNLYKKRFTIKLMSLRNLGGMVSCAKNGNFS
jgi:hypothetical protein